MALTASTMNVEVISVSCCHLSTTSLRLNITQHEDNRKVQSLNPLSAEGCNEIGITIPST